MIQPRIMAGARPFLATQSTLAVATFDDHGAGWASLWFGPPGFATSSPDGARLRLALPAYGPGSPDPVAAVVKEGTPLGILAIDLETRRRLRVNGVVHRRERDALELAVREAYPNCPKYIQRRRLEQLAPEVARTLAAGAELDAPRRAFLRAADTAFVASHHVERGVDASHRGGEPGFIRVEGARTLRIPDYPGNNMFQTLGNLELDPRAGLVVVDFATGRLLSLTGRATLSHGHEDPRHPSGGTGRYWTFEIARWIELVPPFAPRFRLLDRSRFNPPAPSGCPADEEATCPRDC